MKYGESCVVADNSLDKGVFPGPGTTYLPVALDLRVLTEASKGNVEPLRDELGRRLPGSYERVGIDRALAMMVDMALIGIPRGARILDVGCSVGTISLALAAGGFSLVGIDSDVVARVQDWQDAAILVEARAIWNSIDIACEFHTQDLREHLADGNQRYDVALLLSILHHWLSGYGYSGTEQFDREAIRDTLERLCASVERCLYLEVPIEDEAVEMPSDPEGEFFFPAWFLTQGLASSVTLVASTIATNGKPRRLWRVDLS